jgi:hypothetical protein
VHDFVIHIILGANYESGPFTDFLCIEPPQNAKSRECLNFVSKSEDILASGGGVHHQHVRRKPAARLAVHTMDNSLVLNTADIQRHNHSA